MAYTLTLRDEPNYLHAIVTGENSEATVSGYLDALLHECVRRKCTRLLIEEHLEGRRLGTFEVFRIASEGSGRARGHLRAVAYVDANTEGDRMRFAENVAVNRGLNGAVFSSVSDAKAWLGGTA